MYNKKGPATFAKSLIISVGIRTPNLLFRNHKAVHSLSNAHMSFKQTNSSYMFTVLTVLFAIAIAIIQFLKDRTEKMEDDLRQSKLDSVTRELGKKSNDMIAFQRKSFTDLQIMQEQLNQKNEDLLRTQSEIIKLQNTISEHVTGGTNYPSITLKLVFGILSPRRPLYARFYMGNNTQIPFSNISVEYRSSLGSEDGGANPIAFVSFPPGLQTRILSQEIPLGGNLEYHFRIVWSTNFYEMHVKVKLFGADVKSHEVTYTRNKIPIDAPEEYFHIKHAVSSYGPDF